MYGKLNFTDEMGEELELYVVEETKINNTAYLLVTDSDEEEEEGQAFIMKESQNDEGGEVVYSFVEDEAEIAYVSKIFGELLEDIDIEIEE